MNHLPAEDNPSVRMVVTEGRWIGSQERPLMAWISSREGLSSKTGVLILPPIGYQYWSAHRTLRVLAEELASEGHLALRLDYESTGDSGGGQWEADRLSAWRWSVQSAAQELRKLGCEHLTLVGARFGATLALLDGEQLGADALVGWSPVLSGRRYVREIRLLSLAAPDSVAPGAVVSAGTVFSEQTLQEIAKLDCTKIASAPAERVLLLDAVTHQDMADRLGELGCQVTSRELHGGESALESPTEYATVPAEIVGAIRAWLGPGAPVSQPLSPGRDLAEISWGGQSVLERLIELGPDQLVGILTEPRAPSEAAITVVFLNSGSEPHIGPGRAWVEYARELANIGHRCVRVDYRGWGESPDDGYAPGRPYDAHAEADTLAIVRALREDGHERVVLIGLCASAWLALRAVLNEPVAGVIALNPQLYWRRGDPVEATMAETRQRRTPEREREERGQRLGLWTLLDVLGHRSHTARWLDQLSRSQTPVTLMFAEGDDGIEYLRTRHGRHLARVQRAGSVKVLELPDIDHSMHRAWLRPLLIGKLGEEISRF